MIIKLLPCLVLTVISFVLIHVLYQAAKRRVKLKAYNEEATASNVDTVLNGHRYVAQSSFSFFVKISIQ